MLDIVLLIVWVIAGMLNLFSSQPISKLSYFLPWFMVLTFYISKIVVRG